MVEEDRAGEEKSSSRVVFILVAVVAIGIVAFVMFGQRREFTPVGVGLPAPEFTLPDLQGNARSLADYKGKVVFLNFWATWCKPCEEEMPSMQELHNALKGQPFEIVAVSVDTEGPDVVAGFVKKYGVTFPVLHDRKGKIKELYKTTGVPETFIIDQHGVIAEKVWGPRDWSDPLSVEMIFELLKNGPLTPEAYKTARSGS